MSSLDKNLYLILMQKEKNIKVITDVVISVFAMLFFVSLAVIITLNSRCLYYFDIDYFNIPQTSGLSRDVIIENYDVLIDYNSLFNFEELKFPSLPMSETGKIHFEEVKNIFVGFEYFFIATLVIFIVGTIYKVRKKQFGFLKLTSILTVGVPAVLGAIISINWQWFFVKFHEIAFDNDYWIFDAVTDPVITILPDGFFMHCAIMILLLVVISSLLCFVAYRALRVRFDTKENEA